ncbi:leucine efflux protein LeuE [Allostreptomyces psammosilenae]|uniref:Leucine efflux protein n=1 Tax=Allostreptomyces psammosilenae TaxID=1892865 RepID=A0A853A2X1_9ACTN|nr:leucine efflux protein LeuE [Allostreptomyces psammosilenae]NYI07820.1 leucine efflux protein [Allostreptomyces psammosilenae]
MLGVTDLPTYVIGVVAIILLPGPNSLYTLSVAARRGVRAGYTAAAAVFIGDTTLMLLSAAGAASLLRANPVLFTAIKYAGAAYLVWLGIGMLRGAWRSWRGRTGPNHAPDGTGAGAVTSASSAASATAPTSRASTATERPFRRALIVSLLNPKAILFFISYFIQFVDPAYDRPWLSFLLLGAIVQLASMLYLTTLILAGTTLAGYFRSRRRLTAGLSGGVGALFLGFAAQLARATGA